jgi:hypothetical protein
MKRSFTRKATEAKRQVLGTNFEHLMEKYMTLTPKQKEFIDSAQDKEAAFRFYL